jgi:hypothetical protein
VGISAATHRHTMPDDRPELAQRRRQRCEIVGGRLEEEPLALASSLPRGPRHFRCAKHLLRVPHRRHRARQLADEQLPLVPAALEMPPPGVGRCSIQTKFEPISLRSTLSLRWKSDDVWRQCLQ